MKQQPESETFCGARVECVGRERSQPERLDVSAPSRRRWRKLLHRLLVLGLSTLLACGLSEIGVRTFMPQVLFPRYVTNGGFGIRVNVPNAHYWHTSPEMRVQFRMNSMGIRADREYALHKSPGTIRIVGLGDSFTQGYEVDVHDTYLYRVEEKLCAKGYPVEVINLGVSGHGTAEELIMLKESGFRFTPDVVIVGYYQNDPADNVRSNLYRLDEHDRLVRAAASYLPAIGIRNKLYAFALYRWLAEHSQLLSLVRESVARIVKRKKVEANLAVAPDGETDRYPALLGARLLDEIKHECSQQGVKFVLLDIPGDRLRRSNLPETLLERISQDEIVRAGPVLRAQRADAYLYRRRGHRHWTPAGHEIAAELLSNKLTRILGRHEP